jgi:hypothetical protein
MHVALRFAPEAVRHEPALALVQANTAPEVRARLRMLTTIADGREALVADIETIYAEAQAAQARRALSDALQHLAKVRAHLDLAERAYARYAMTDATRELNAATEKADEATAQLDFILALWRWLEAADEQNANALATLIKRLAPLSAKANDPRVTPQSRVMTYSARAAIIEIRALTGDPHRDPSVLATMLAAADAEITSANAAITRDTHV